MLRLDDELAGLTEAANVPADQQGAHPTTPDVLSPMAGEVPMHQCKSAATFRAHVIVPLSLAVLEVHCT